MCSFCGCSVCLFALSFTQHFEWWIENMCIFISLFIVNWQQNNWNHKRSLLFYENEWPVIGRLFDSIQLHIGRTIESATVAAIRFEKQVGTFFAATHKQVIILIDNSIKRMCFELISESVQRLWANNSHLTTKYKLHVSKRRKRTTSRKMYRKKKRTFQFQMHSRYVTITTIQLLNKPFLWKCQVNNWTKPYLRENFKLINFNSLFLVLEEITWHLSDPKRRKKLRRIWLFCF